MNISNINTYDSDLFLNIRLMCERRNVNFSKIEIVNLFAFIEPPRLDLEILVPTNKQFYFIKSLRYITNLGQALTGIPRIFFFSPGIINVPVDVISYNFSFGAVNTNNLILENMEVNSLDYQANNHTAGSFALVGTAYKIFHD